MTIERPEEENEKNLFIINDESFVDFEMFEDYLDLNIGSEHVTQEEKLNKFREKAFNYLMFL